MLNCSMLSIAYSEAFLFCSREMNIREAEILNKKTISRDLQWLFQRVLKTIRALAHMSVADDSKTVYHLFSNSKHGY